jgi:hypothetical protein
MHVLHAHCPSTITQHTVTWQPRCFQFTWLLRLLPSHCIPTGLRRHSFITVRHSESLADAYIPSPAPVRYLLRMHVLNASTKVEVIPSPLIKVTLNAKPEIRSYIPG